MIGNLKKTRVLVDTDPNMWVPRRDIDDALALVFLFASPEAEIEGITINFGNVSAPVGYAAARELLERVGLSIPLFKGAESKHDLGKKNEAIEFMIQTVKDAPGEITLLALAPLTNVAGAMLLDPTFAQNLGGLIVMGGAFRFPLFSFFGEFNFHCDGRAASTALSASVSKIMITMDLCSQAVFTQRHLRILKEREDEMAQYILRFVEPWLSLNKRIFFRKKGFFPWDVVAAAALIDDSLFDEDHLTFSIRERGPRRGSLIPVSPSAEHPSAQTVCQANVPGSLAADRFMDLFLSRLDPFCPSVLS
jgi:inosine-uridine nucleoside N-ribohydrolase